MVELRIDDSRQHLRGCSSSVVKGGFAQGDGMSSLWITLITEISTNKSEHVLCPVRSCILNEDDSFYLYFLATHVQGLYGSLRQQMFTCWYLLFKIISVPF